jgi:hypothetical protein
MVLEGLGTIALFESLVKVGSSTRREFVISDYRTDYPTFL